MTLRPQYLTDPAGKRISVVLSVEEFNLLLEKVEDAEDVKLYDETKNSKQVFVDAKEAFADI